LLLSGRVNRDHQAQEENKSDDGFRAEISHDGLGLEVIVEWALDGTAKHAAK